MVVVVVVVGDLEGMGWMQADVSGLGRGKNWGICDVGSRWAVGFPNRCLFEEICLIDDLIWATICSDK